MEVTVVVVVVGAGCCCPVDCCLCLCLWCAVLMNINLRQVQSNLRIQIITIGPFRLIVISIGDTELRSFGFVSDEFQRSAISWHRENPFVEFEDQLDSDQLEELARIDDTLS